MIWTNGRDSLVHALNHFVEMSQIKGNKWHHQKWIIMSVHHAASCLVYMWLKSANNNHRLFRNEKGGEAYPHLEDTLSALQQYKGTEHLTDAESKLLILLKRLNDIRNKLMHRLPPEQISKEVVAYAATSFIGMLLAIERRTGKAFNEYFDDFIEDRRYVFDAIHYSKIEEYQDYIEHLLKDKGYSWDLPYCPCCAAKAVIGYRCEVCFEEVEEVECSNCGDEFYIERSAPVDQECPECGNIVKSA